MAGPLLVGAEDIILVSNKKTFGSSRPLMEGLELVTMLKHFPTSRTVVMVEIEDVKTADTWVKMHGLKEVIVVGIPPEDRYEPPDVAQWYTIERQRALGPVNLVLTAFPEVYRRCTASHQPVLLYGRRGAVISEEDRPTWDELHASVMRSREAAVEEDDDPLAD